MEYVTTEIDRGGLIVRRALGIPPALTGEYAIVRRYPHRAAALAALDELGGVVPQVLVDEGLATGLAFPVDA